MLAPLTALMARSLRLDARAMRAHLLRLLLGVMIALALMKHGFQVAIRSASGLDLLWSMVWTAWWALVLVAAGRFASAITEEKEENCLPLLRMAGLRPLAILLGKAATMLWEVLLLVGTLLPVAVLAVTLGGVSLGQVWAAVAMLAAWTVFLAGLGLLCSVLCRSHGWAAALLLATVLLTLVGTALAAALLPIPATATAWSLTSWSRLSEILALGFDGGAFDRAVAAHLAGGALCFLLAWLLFDACAGDREGGGEVKPVRAGRLTLRARPGRPRGGWRALLWKDFHFLCGGRQLLLVRVLVMTAIVCGGLLLLPDPTDPAALAWLLCGIAVVWQTFDIGIKLARIFAIEVRGQTLDGIAVLPPSPGRQVASKVAAVALSTLPATAVFAAGLGFAVPALLKGLHDNPEFLLYLVPMLIGYAARIVLFWYICALTSLYVRTGAFFVAIGIAIGVWIAEGIVGTILAFIAMAVTAVSRSTSGMMLGMGIATMVSASVTIGLCIGAHFWFMRRWRALPGR